MRARWRGLGALKLALPTAAALGAGAAIAVGSIPGGDGTITGCYANKFEEDQPENVLVNDVSEAPGTLRVINPNGARLPTAGPDAARECVPGESMITWNQSGPAGPQGPQGPQGLRGPQGGAGASGANGTSVVGGTEVGIGGGGETFLRIDGIERESTDSQHKGEIVVDSFSLGATQTSHAVGSASGSGAGKVSFQDFTITKKLDKSSPLLFQAAASGKHFPTIVLAFAKKTGGKNLDYLKFTFQNVLISSVADGQSAQQVPSEQVTFQFQKCTEEYIGNAKGGKPGSKVKLNITVNAKL